MSENEADAHIAGVGEVNGRARSGTLHHCRQLSEDLVLSFGLHRYISQTGLRPRQALRGEAATLVTYPDHNVELLHGEEVLPFKVFDPDRTVMAPDFYPYASFR